MKYLNHSWDNFFDQFREREMMIMLSFKQFQKQDVESVRERLKHRCLL
jgi:hypothetical protein